MVTQQGTALREAFAGLVGAVRVRNLEVDGPLALPEVVCEISLEDGEIAFRSDASCRSVNPSWTLLEPLPGREGWQMRAAGCARAGSLLSAVLTLRVLHAADETIVLERRFSLNSLSRTGLLSNEMDRAAPMDPNAVFLGLRHAAVAVVADTGVRPSGEALYLWAVPPASPPSAAEEQLAAVSSTSSSKCVEALAPAKRKALLELLSKVSEAEARATAAEDRAQALCEAQVASARRAWAAQLGAARKQALTVRKAALDSECAALRASIEAQRMALAEKLERLGQALASLRTEETREGEEPDSVALARERFTKEQCFVRAHRIKLLRALHSVYPLEERYTESGRWECTVRGIPLSAEVLAAPSFATHEEERASTALGYVAHFVQLLAKYLDMPLRFVPLPQSSSSTICDPLEIAAETPHEPLARYQGASGSDQPSFPHHIFGSASGRLGRATARKALAKGSYPLFWRGLQKNARSRFQEAAVLLDRSVQLLAFTHGARGSPARPADTRPVHLIARLRRVLADFAQ